MIARLKDVLRRAEAWPERAQGELAEIALEIDATLNTHVYKASADELRVIDEADASGIASDTEVEGIRDLPALVKVECSKPGRTRG